MPPNPENQHYHPKTYQQQANTSKLYYTNPKHQQNTENTTTTTKTHKTLEPSNQTNKHNK